MTQLVITEAGPEPDRELSQWFTDPRVAAALINLARPTLLDVYRRQYTYRVLEPSAGRGHLIRAVLDECPNARVEACELDGRWRPDLEALIPVDRITIGDYLQRPAPAQPYDLAPCNLPFDDGAEVYHLEKLINESRRILALLPVRSLHGRERYERVWYRFDAKSGKQDWYVRQKIQAIGRPRFGKRIATGEERIKSSGGIDEIVLLDLRQVPGPCDVGWL